MNPDGWTEGDEQGYQQEIANLQSRLHAAFAAGNTEQIGSVGNTLDQMLDHKTGRQYWLKAKANGWL